MPLELLAQPLVFLVFAIPLVLALTFHEFAHAWLADQFGDPTPRLAGRVSLNPLAHLDPIGTIALFLVGFGWAKPVPVDSRHFAKPVAQEIQVALAGPFANLLFAVVVGLILRFVSLPMLVENLGQFLVQINLVLMVFNLIPLPPLDGSRLLQLVVPEETYLTLEQYGPFILLFLLLGSSFGSFNFFGQILDVTVVPLARIITGVSF